MRLPYLPVLDGLRALAVTAVLLYHADLRWIPGGFLGVDVFFVLSGYLITSLLLAEWRQRGSIDLKAFWLRRARRLLPALYVLLVVTLTFAVVFLPGEVAELRGDVLAAFGYVTNWYLIFQHQSYFEAVGRPSLLQHLWSLAVEEQFYLLWPLVLAVGLGMGAMRRRYRRMMYLALGIAAASAALMTLFYRPDIDPSRVYYGTDTRATGLLCGAALAFIWVPERLADKGSFYRTLSSTRFRRRWAWIAPALLDVAGIATLGALVFFCLSLGEFQPFLYQGGLATVALTTTALIAVVAHPRARVVSWMLGSAPLRWVGERSYGIYLWHWPVFMVTRPNLDVPFEGLPLVALRIAVTVLLADLSYRFVETPIRRGALGRAWRDLREVRGPRRWRLRRQWVGVVVPILASCALLGVTVAQAKPPQKPSYLSTKHVRIEAANHGAVPTATVDKGTAPSENAASKAAANGPSSRDTLAQTRESTAQRTSEFTTGPSATASAGPVTAVGDSVMLGAVDALRRDIPNLTTIDARGSRQIPEAIGVLRQLRATGELGEVVIVHMGDNGIVTDQQFDRMMRVLSGAREVLVVNTTVPDGHQWAPNNEVLADGAARYPEKAVLVDWHAASAGHPGYFWDGLHLTPQGARAYARLITAAYRAHSR